MQKIVILSVLIIMFGFDTAPKDERLFKTWILTNVESGKCFTRTYKDTTEFGNHIGFKFLKHGKLIARLPDNGWCPVGVTQKKYAIVKGKWKKESDSIYVLTYPVYPNAEKVRISLLTENQLVLKRTICK